MSHPQPAEPLRRLTPASSSRLARLQQLLVAFVAGLAALWICLLWSRSILAAVVGIMVVLTAHAFVLAIEFFAVAVVNRADSVPRADACALVRAWWGEVLVAPTVFAWRQPFQWRLFPDDSQDLVVAGETRAVVFVHGFVCNRGLWLPWLKELRERRVRYTTVNLEPVFGSIENYVPGIDDAVRRAQEMTGNAPVVVCHSMGGLAVRAWMAADASNKDRIHRVVTIGSPHHGTWLARFSVSANGRQMRLNGDWLSALARREAAHRSDPYRKFICWYSNADNIVFPASTALLPGADNRHVPGVAHVALTFHPEVMTTSLELLSSAPSSGDIVTKR